MKKTASVCVLLIWSVCGSALAQSASDRITAEALFDTGRRLQEEGQYAEACPKLAESQRLDPAVGTLLNLADCYEKWGRTASAWSTWLEAVAAAKAAGQKDRERIARDRAAAIKTRLITITVNVPEANRIPGLEVRRDDTAVGIAQWGTGVPADPGTHTVGASAPNYQSWNTTVTIVDGSKPVQITVPRLELETTQLFPPIPPLVGATTPLQQGATAAPLPPPPPQQQQQGASTSASGTQRQAAWSPRDTTRLSPATEKPGNSGSKQVRWGYVVGGVGVVGTIVGVVMGFRAKSKNDDSKQYCRAEDVCNQTGYDLRRDAGNAATYSTVAFGLGAAALAGGIVLLATAPSAESTEHPPSAPQARLKVEGNVSGSIAQLSLRGAF